MTAPIPSTHESLYDAAMALLSTLIDLDPEEDSPEGRLLVSLAAAVREYERGSA